MNAVIKTSLILIGSIAIALLSAGEEKRDGKGRLKVIRFRKKTSKAYNQGFEDGQNY